MENTSDDDDHHHHLHLPQDVLIQILVLLPVISLLRFKSVCKSWLALIQSSLFIDLQLNTTSNNNNNNFGTFIYQTSDFITLRESKNEAFMLSSGGGGGGGGIEELKLEDLCFPPHYKVAQGLCLDIFMLGSCNGLVCIHDTIQRDVSLWNPATRQFRLLPKSLTLVGLGEFEQDFVAFGYDVKTKDYKVVQISHFRPYTSSAYGWLSVKEYIVRVQVYSLNTDSWRLLEGINSFPVVPHQEGGLNNGVYLNGSHYFIGSYTFDIDPDQDGTRYMILSFDFTKEIFSTIQFPHHKDSMNITCLGEKLAVFALVAMSDYELKPRCFYYDLWVLNEHESWTKLHSIGLNGYQHYIPGVPYNISNNGEFALIHTKYDDCKLLQLFNLLTKEVKREFPVSRLMGAHVYKQSLVSIVGGNDDTATDRVIGVAM